MLDILAEASTRIMGTEAEKGEKAAKARDIYMGLMGDLGYV